MTGPFRIFVPATSVVLFVSETFVVTSAYVLASYFTLAVDPWVYLLYDGGFLRLTPVLFTILVGMYLNDLYSRFYVKNRVVLLQQIGLVVGAAILVQGFLSYLNPYMRLSGRVMAVGSALALVLAYLWRVLFSSFAAKVVGRDRLLMVGESQLLEDIAGHLENHPELGLEVAGYADDTHPPGARLRGGKVLGPLAGLKDIVQATRANRLIVGMSERRNHLPVAELLELRLAGHIIEEAGTAFERVCGRICLKEVRPSQLIYSEELGPRSQSPVGQTVLNRLAAAAGLVVLSPILALTALAVRLSSSGPVLSRELRMGLNDVPFTEYQFRAGTTGAGGIVRKLRFDKLPLLFNTLKGDMSIVGPRPEAPELVEELSRKIPYYQQRHRVRPGITGWAQINFDRDGTLDETMTRLEYDLYYVKNMSLSLDLYIVFHTVKSMLLSRGLAERTVITEDKY